MASTSSRQPAGSTGSSGVIRPSGVTATSGDNTSPAPGVHQAAYDRPVGEREPVELQRREQRRRCQCSAAAEERVHPPDEPRVAQREVGVADAPAAGEQVERELQRRQPPVARDLLEVLGALARRLLEALDHGPALELVLDQRVGELVVAPEGGGELDRVLDGELGARADREVRGVRGVAQQHRRAGAPVLAAELVEGEPHGAVGQQLATVEHGREELAAEREALLLGERVEPGAPPRVLSRLDDERARALRRTDRRAPGRRRAPSRRTRR